MKVITAPEEIIEQTIFPTVFLAGGITNCPNWQNKVIDILRPYDIGHILNPRRDNFPIHDPNAAKEQIEWEFHALNNADVFSMWFSGADSVQPICMYELGRHIALRLHKLDTVVIGIEDGYRRSLDVFIQLGLIDKGLSRRISNDIETHAINIVNALKGIQ